MRWPEFSDLVAGLLTREHSALRRITSPPQPHEGDEEPTGEE